MTKLSNPSMRCDIRLETDCAVSARLPSLNLALEVRNVSRGGVQTISRRPFEPGTTHIVEFRCLKAEARFLWARVIYCLPLPDAYGRSFGTGWAWARDETTTENAEAIVNGLTDICDLVESGATRVAALR